MFKYQKYVSVCTVDDTLCKSYATKMNYASENIYLQGMLPGQ